MRRPRRFVEPKAALGQELKGCFKLTGPRAVSARSAQDHSMVLVKYGPPGAVVAAASRDGSRSDPELDSARPELGG